MLIVGLTGSIGMGKSTVASQFRARGIAVTDADAIVHALYDAEAAPLVEAAFPGTASNGRVDRARLASALARNGDAFGRLEAIVHPLVREAERAFLEREVARGARLAVLEIPLLFETGGDALVDVVVVASASPEAQRARVLARAGMTAGKFEALSSRQMPDREKRARADFVVDTSGTIEETNAQVDAILSVLGEGAGLAYHRHWTER